MEVRHVFNKEILSVMNKPLEAVFLVKSGRLVLMDRDEQLLATFGPCAACGLGELISKSPLEGNLLASGTTSVLTFEKNILEAEINSLDENLKLMIAGLQSMLKRHLRK